MKINWNNPAIYITATSLVATLVITVVAPAIAVICAWTYHLADMMMP